MPKKMEILIDGRFQLRKRPTALVNQNLANPAITNTSLQNHATPTSSLPTFLTLW
jgi:hypothetical protein